MSPGGGSDAEEFRRAGHRAVDWVADYLARPERHPVLARVAPGEIARALPAAAPATGEPLERILDDFERILLPGVTHWNHPGFLAYFGITGSAPGVLADLLSSALNVNAMLWRTSPAATELEQTTLAWLAQALGLEPALFGLITDTASISSLLALAAARDQALPAARRDGLAAGASAGRLRLYASAEAHSSIDKAAVLLGVGLDNVVKIPTDAEFRLDPEALARQVDADLARGHRPFAVVATVGTTSTTSVDPVGPIADLAERHGLWLHVDAAYAGAAALVPDMAWVLAGCERADSIVVNPHKWLLVPFDLSVLYTRRPEALKRAFHLVPEYLVTPDEGVVNFMDYGIQLGRRFRALKLWFVLRAYGTAGIAGVLERHLRLARGLTARVQASPDLELMAPAPFSVVCLRARPRGLLGREAEPAVAAHLDRLNAQVLEEVNASGEVFLSHTRLGGRFVMRVAIGNERTEERHVRRAEELILAAARRLQGETGGPGP